MQPLGKKRGRPSGSKNKPKLSAVLSANRDSPVGVEAVHQSEPDVQLLPQKAIRPAQTFRREAFNRTLDALQIHADFVQTLYTTVDPSPSPSVSPEATSPVSSQAPQSNCFPLTTGPWDRQSRAIDDDDQSGEESDDDSEETTLDNDLLISSHPENDAVDADGSSPDVDSHIGSPVEEYLTLIREGLAAGKFKRMLENGIFYIHPPCPTVPTISRMGSFEPFLVPIVMVFDPLVAWKGCCEIVCPNGCSSASGLQRHGFATRNAVTLDRDMKIIGPRFKCTHCELVRRGQAGSTRQYTFNVFDGAVLAQLPHFVRSYLPVFFSHRSAVHSNIVELSNLGSAMGAGSSVIAKVTNEMRAAWHTSQCKSYWETCEVRRGVSQSSATSQQRIGAFFSNRSVPPPASAYRDPQGWNQREISDQFLSAISTQATASEMPYWERYFQTLGGEVYKGDCSYKHSKHYQRHKGQKIFECVHTGMNELNQWVHQVSLISDNHDDIRPSLWQYARRCLVNGLELPKVAYTDRACKDWNLYAGTLGNARACLVGSEQAAALVQSFVDQQRQALQPDLHPHARSLLEPLFRLLENMCRNSIRPVALKTFEDLSHEPALERAMALSSSRLLADVITAAISFTHRIDSDELAGMTEGADLCLHIVQCLPQTLPPNPASITHDTVENCIAADLGIPSFEWPSSLSDAAHAQQHVPVVSTIAAMNAKAAMLIGYLCQLPPHQRIVGVDMEWAVDFRRRAGRWESSRSPVQTVQVSALDGTAVIFCIGALKSALPPRLMQLLFEDESIRKAGVHIKADYTKLCKDYQIDVQPKGIVEIGAALENAGFGKCRKISLATAAWLVFGIRLDKSEELRVSSSWSRIDLPPAHVLYAARDSFVACAMLSIIQQLPDARIPLAPELAVGEAAVDIVRSGSDAEIVAVGTIVAAIEFQGIRLKDFERVVRVEIVVQPNYRTPSSSDTRFARLRSPYSTSLGSMGPPPFFIVSSLSNLRPRRRWTKPPPIPARANTTLDFIFSCKGDPWHFIDGFPVSSKKHVAYLSFVGDLSMAMFILDPVTKEAVRKRLEQFGMLPDNFDQWCTVSKWCRSYIKRSMAPASEQGPRVLAVASKFRTAIDHDRGGVALIPDFLWDRAMAHIAHVNHGCHSDPVGVDLYMEVGVDKNGFRRFECSRGTSQLEGGAHKDMERMAGSHNMSYRLGNGILARQRFRASVAQSRKRSALANPGHFVYSMIEDCNEITSRMYGCPAFPRWPSVRAFADTGELAGVCPITFAHQEIDHPDPVAAMTPDHQYLATRMGTKIPYLPVATNDEFKLIDGLFRKMTATIPDTVAIAKHVSLLADGKTVFLKRPAHIQKYYTIWNRQVNVSVSRASSSKTRPSAQVASSMRSGQVAPSNSMSSRRSLILHPPPAPVNLVTIVDDAIANVVAATRPPDRALAIPTTAAVMIPPAILVAPPTTGRKKEVKPRQRRRCRLCSKEECSRAANGKSPCVGST